MASTCVALSASDHDHDATRRLLDSHDLDCKISPTVEIKTIGFQSASSLSVLNPNPVDVSSARASPDIESSFTDEVIPKQPNYGHRLIPQLIDERARSRPQDPVWSVPDSSNLADGFRDISYAQVARAINRAAWWIHENIGKSTTFETLAYIGPPDLRYAISTIAAQKTGHTVIQQLHQILINNVLMLPRRSSLLIGTPRRTTYTSSNR